MNSHILFSMGPDWLSKTIRFIEGGHFSHVELLRPATGDIICATNPAGVVRRTLAERLANCHEYAICEVPEADADAVWEWAEARLGLPYDLWGALAIPFRIKGWDHPDQWWCSEFVAGAHHEIGVPITRADHWRIGVRTLYESTGISVVETGVGHLGRRCK